MIDDESPKPSSPATDPSKSKFPIPLSPDDQTLYLKYREMFMPAARLSNYDEFSKWLFTVSATVGTFGAAFSNAAFTKLSGFGAIMFGIAVALVGLSLGMATFARTVDLPQEYWSTLEDMLGYAKTTVRWKHWLTLLGGILLGLALICASLAPSLSSIPLPVSPNAYVTYILGKDGVHVAFVLRGYAPGSVIEGSVLAVDDSEKTLAAGRSVAGNDGSANLDLMTAVPPAGAKQLEWRWTRTQGNSSLTQQGSVSLERSNADPQMKSAQQVGQSRGDKGCPRHPHSERGLAEKIARGCKESKGKPVTVQCLSGGFAVYDCPK
jgi:hypothetical protein